MSVVTQRFNAITVILKTEQYPGLQHSHLCFLHQIKSGVIRRMKSCSCKQNPSLPFCKHRAKKKIFPIKHLWMMWYQNQDYFFSFSAFSKWYSDLADNGFANQTDMLEKVFKNVTGGLKDPDWLISAAILQMLSLTLRTWSVWFGVFPHRRQTGFHFLLISLSIMCYNKRLTPGPSHVQGYLTRTWCRDGLHQSFSQGAAPQVNEKARKSIPQY